MIVFETVQFIFEDVEYQAEIMVQSHVENDFGADADGNRGIALRVIDDCEVSCIYNVYGQRVVPSDQMIEKALNELAA